MAIILNRKVTTRTIYQDALNHLINGEYVRAVKYSIPKWVELGKTYKLTIKIIKVVNCVGIAEVLSAEVANEY